MDSTAKSSDMVSITRTRIRLALSATDAGKRIGTAFNDRHWPFTDDEVRQDPELAELVEKYPRHEWHDGVTITHGGIIYDVVLEDLAGIPSLIYCAETAAHGMLPERGLTRKRLAYIAKEFLDSTHVLAIGSKIHRGPERPADNELVRIIQDALANGKSPRKELAEKLHVEIATADNWIRYARDLPNSPIPPPRGNRGRPRTKRKAD